MTSVREGHATRVTVGPCLSRHHEGVTHSANGLLFEKRPTAYVMINIGQGLVSLAVMGAIIGFFH